MPELEFGKAAHERLELVGRLCGKVSAAALLHILGGLETRVELGRDEGEEQIQKVDAESVCDCERVSGEADEKLDLMGRRTNVPALSQEDAQTEHQEDDTSSDPSVCLVRC